jgi:hypothetical protein
MRQKAPDVMLLGPEWPERAFVRAQLIEAGYDVVAIDTWPVPQLYRHPGMRPRVMLIDLHGLPNPRQTLDEVRLVLPPERVLVVTALGSLPAEAVHQLGFDVVRRPVTIGEIVSATAALFSRTAPEHDHGLPRRKA